MQTESLIVEVPTGASEDGNWSDPDIVAEDRIVFAVARVNDDLTWIDCYGCWVDCDWSLVHRRRRVFHRWLIADRGSAATETEDKQDAQRYEVAYFHGSNPGAFLASGSFERVKKRSGDAISQCVFV
jgi:hypothetical protein